MTDVKLREIFRLAGTVLEAAVRYDTDGKSLGRAIVRFEHPMEAVQAICILLRQSLMRINVETKIKAISSDIHQLQCIKLHRFKLERV